MFLLDRGYPYKPALQLVGDKYRLSADQRNILFRGVLPTADVKIISQKTISTVSSSYSEIAVDGYNVVLTIVNYYLGKLLFLSNDGLIRDSGGIHGKIKHTELLGRAIQRLVQFLKNDAFPAYLGRSMKIDVFLDAPVSHSRDHAAIFLEAANRNSEGEEDSSGQSFSVEVVQSADYRLMKKVRGIIATSDSDVIKKANVPVFDLACAFLRQKGDFSPHIDVRQLLNHAGEPHESEGQ